MEIFAGAKFSFRSKELFEFSLPFAFEFDAMLRINYFGTKDCIIVPILLKFRINLFSKSFLKRFKANFIYAIAP